MGKFNIDQYTPEQDSSASLREFAQESDKVALAVGSGYCQCGCEKPVKPTSTFRQGHDARFKGILIRAHLTDTEIFLNHGGNATQTSAFHLAEERGWEKFLLNAQDRQHATPKKKNQAKQATSPIGGLRDVKIGRWTYTGEIVDYTRDTVTVRVTMKNGTVKETEVPRQF